MKSGDLELLKKEVLPTKQINVYLGLEILLMTYHEMNFSDSVEKVQPQKAKEIYFENWFSWN